eukprot:1030488-Rhodomonas_salina.2
MGCFRILHLASKCRHSLHPCARAGGECGWFCDVELVQHCWILAPSVWRDVRDVIGGVAYGSGAASGCG